jgi:hypothetical protein
LARAPRKRPPGTIVPDGHKWCPGCDQVLPLEDFARTKATAGGHHGYCRPCHNANGRASRDRVGGARTYRLKRRYGMSAQEVDAMAASQGGLCALCREAPAEHVDHDHRTGRVRGVLCFNCNGGLGQFRDREDLLASAIAYLQGVTWADLLDQESVYLSISSRRDRLPSSTS